MRIRHFEIQHNDIINFVFEYTIQHRGQKYKLGVEFLGFASHVNQPNGQEILYTSPKLNQVEKSDTSIRRIYDTFVRRMDELEWKMGRVPYTPYEFPVRDITLPNPHTKGREISNLLEVEIDTPVLLEFEDKSVVGYMFRREGKSVRLFSIKKRNFPWLSISDRAPFNLGTHIEDRCNAYELKPEFPELDVLVNSSYELARFASSF